MGKIAINQKRTKQQAVAVKNCNTPKFVHNRIKRELRSEIRQHFRAIWRCYLIARRARLDYKLNNMKGNN